MVRLKRVRRWRHWTLKGLCSQQKKSEGLLGFLDLGLSLLSLHFQRERERERDELTEAIVKREKREANRG